METWLAVSWQSKKKIADTTVRLWLHVVSHVWGAYTHTHTQRQRRAFWACDVWGMKTEDPRERQECQTVRERAMRKTCSSWSDASCERSSMKAWSGGWGFSWQPPDPSFKSFFQSYAKSRQHNRRLPKARSHTHLGSLQHLPFVEDLHGENLVCVSDFDNGDLQEGQQCGLKKLF